MNTSIQIKGITELDKVCDMLLNICKSEKKFAFYGDLGAGKTTIIKAICEKMGVLETVSSPTFPIINEYVLDDTSNIYHMDFYRIKNIDEAINIGAVEYLESDAFCFIEWPYKIDEILPDNIVKVEITVNKKNDHRTITIIK